MRLVVIGVAWVVGIWLAAGFVEITPAHWVAVAAGTSFAVWRFRHASDLLLLSVAVLALALAGFRYAIEPRGSEVAALNNIGGVMLEGVVIDDPQIRDDRVQFRVRVDTRVLGDGPVPISGLVLVQVPRLSEIAYGDRVGVGGQLVTPGQYDTFSYADFLARQNVYSINPNANVHVQSSGHGSPFYAALFDLRHRANDAINAALPEPQASLLAGILLGNERGISPEVEDAFSATGAAHIIAISGFNMAIIAGILMGTNPEDRRWWRVFVGVAVIGVYTLFVGANAAVIRAALMSMLLVVGQSLKRQAFVPASLMFAALVMSLLDPDVLWDISFQLSFFATLGLALFVEPIQRMFRQLLAWMFPAGVGRMVGHVLQEPVVVTIAAQITTLPLIVLYFERVSLVSLLVNLLVIGVQPFILIFGGLATILSFALPFLAQMLYAVTYVMLWWTTGVVRFFGGLDFADVAFRVESEYILLYFVIVIGGAMLHATQPQWLSSLFVFVRRRSVLSAVVASGVSLVVLMGMIVTNRPDGNLHVWFLDMGHSNAVLVQTPGGAQLLVDGGRYPSRLLTALGDRMPFNDRDIDVLVVTHPNEYDIAALPAVIERYNVGLALTNGQLNFLDTVVTIEEMLLNADTPVIPVTAGYTLDFDDGLRVEVLHPQQTPTIQDAIATGSVVLRLSYGDISFLLPSGIPPQNQQQLLDAGNWPLSTVMLLPQHGTARSLDYNFLEAAQPSAIVIQVDRANRRGDPDPDLLDMLPEGVPVYRTDERGTLHFWTDGTNLWTAD